MFYLYKYYNKLGGVFMEVGKRIIELREKKNFTTNYLANKAGISQSYLRAIELGKKNPTVEMLTYICDALEISLCNFFTDGVKNVSPFLLSTIDLLTEKEQILLSELISEMKKDDRL